MVYFLSDAHLGSKALDRDFARQKKLCILLRRMGKDATSVYLLGDMFDFWFEYFIHDKSKKQYAEFFHTIRHLIHKGVRVHFFTGNHDLWTFGGLQKMTGMVVHHHPYSVSVGEKTVYMAHGDGLVPHHLSAHFSAEECSMIKRFMRLRAFFHSHTAQFLFRCLPPKIGNALGYGWAKRSRQRELDNPVPYRGEDKEALVLFAKEKEARHHYDYYIFGHRHIDLDLQIAPTSRVVLLGDCFKLWTYAKIDEQGELELCTFTAEDMKKTEVD